MKRCLLPVLLAAAVLGTCSCGTDHPSRAHSGGTRPPATTSRSQASTGKGTPAPRGTPSAATPVPGITPLLTPPVPVGTPGPTAVPIATPTPTPPVSVTQPDTPSGVALTLFPDGAAACNTANLDYLSCPVTPALAKVLGSDPIPGVQPLCRCSDPWQSVHVSVLSATPTTATVVVTLSWGTAASSEITLALVYDGKWEAANTYCTTLGLQSSIFSQSPPLCPTVSP